MIKRKKKKIDPATYMRFKRERRCFDPMHPETIDIYAHKVEGYALRVWELEEKNHHLQESLKQMISKEVAEEQAKTSMISGYHQGEKDAEEKLRKEKVCFHSFHKFYEGKRVMNLDFGGVMSLFLYLVDSPFSEGEKDKITALVPKNFIAKGGSSRLESDALFNKLVGKLFRNVPFIK